MLGLVPVNFASLQKALTNTLVAGGFLIFFLP
jgi:hypothetical protein